MRLAIASLAAAFLLPSPASAQSAVSGPVMEDVKINQMIVYGDEACPASTDDVITVCARRPEGDRYRIPENLRGLDPSEDSWVNRAESLEYVGSGGIGSCSPVGPGGSVGCLTQLINQARAERANSDEVNWNRLIEEARQERLGRIDAEAASVERQIRGDQ
jgi:hypothetical protein